jgi:hypothetical protein
MQMLEAQQPDEEFMGWWQGANLAGSGPPRPHRGPHYGLASLGYVNR